jgi:hypothetical protein
VPTPHWHRRRGLQFDVWTLVGSAADLPTTQQLQQRVDVCYYCSTIWRTWCTTPIYANTVLKFEAIATRWTYRAGRSSIYETNDTPAPEPHVEQIVGLNHNANAFASVKRKQLFYANTAHDRIRCDNGEK